MDDIIKIVESLEKSNLLTDGAGETVKDTMKELEMDFLGSVMESMDASLIGHIAS